MSTDSPVSQLEDPIPCFDNYLIDPLMPLSHNFEPQALIPESTSGVYVPFEYSPLAHVTSTQKGTTTRHDAFESPPYKVLSARARYTSHHLLPDDLPSPYRIQPPSESMTPPLRLQVGSPALASAKRKIRTHEAKYFCEIDGCGHDFTTKQNLKSMFTIITIFSLFVRFANKRDAPLDHYDSHYNIKRHVCSACTRPFVLLHGLTRHRKTCKLLAARAQ